MFHFHSYPFSLSGEPLATCLEFTFIPNFCIVRGGHSSSVTHLLASSQQKEKDPTGSYTSLNKPFLIILLSCFIQGFYYKTYNYSISWNFVRALAVKILRKKITGLCVKIFPCLTKCGIWIHSHTIVFKDRERTRAIRR